MDHKVFLEERNIRITDKTLTVGDKSFPIRGITTVRYREFKPNILQALGCLIPGILILIWGGLSILSQIVMEQADGLGVFLAIGIVCIFGGLYLLGARKEPYSILISAAGMFAETVVLSDSNKFYVKRVHRALNQAIEESAT